MDAVLMNELVDQYSESAKAVMAKLYDQAKFRNKIVLWIIGILLGVIVFISKTDKLDFSEFPFQGLTSLIMLLVASGVLFQVITLIYLNKNMVLEEMYVMQRIALKNKLEIIENESFAEIYKKIKFLKYVGEEANFQSYFRAEGRYRLLLNIIFLSILGVALAILRIIIFN